MDFLALVRLAINSVSLLLVNPALGGRNNIRVTQAVELLGVLDALIEEGEDAYDDLKAFTEQVRGIAAEGRSPTPDEWESLRVRKQSAHDRLQAVKEEILGEEEQEDDQETSSPEPTDETQADEDDDNVIPV